jgi:hypothetical protein
LSVERKKRHRRDGAELRGMQGGVHENVIDREGQLRE